jgi:hypothetical protein
VCQARVESLLMGRRPGRGCCTLGRREMGYGTRPHDWKTHELEPMKNSVSPRLRACPSSLYVPQPIVAGQHECQAGMPHQVYLTSHPRDTIRHPSPPNATEFLAVLRIASQPWPKEVLTATGYGLTYGHSHSSSQLGNRDAERLGGARNVASSPPSSPVSSVQWFRSPTTPSSTLRPP